MTVPVALYGFQCAPDVRVVTEAGGWQGWFKDTAAPLIAKGFPDHHLHNPFGLHDLRGVAGRDDRVMHVDQFDLFTAKSFGGSQTAMASPRSSGRSTLAGARSGPT